MLLGHRAQDINRREEPRILLTSSLVRREPERLRALSIAV